MWLIEAIRDRVASGTTSLFKHADYPLAATLDHPGDAGLMGPGSVSWEVVADPAAFVGGVRALLLQAAHPEVAAGVADHSRYRDDPLGRLSRTSNYVTASTYGAMPEVADAVAAVRRIHRPVRGTSHRGVAYTADVPDLAAWVHNALTDSFLVTYAEFGPRALSTSEADRFVAEQAQVGELLDASPLPRSAESLQHWIESHRGLARSPGMVDAVRFLRRPPLTWSVRWGYRFLRWGAVATIPVSLRRVLGVRRYPGARWAARATVWFLRWSIGSSPSWKLALMRVGAPIPDGVFRQPLPIDELEEWGRGRAEGARQSRVSRSKPHDG